MGMHDDGAEVGCLTQDCPYGFCALDYDWRFTYVNERAEQILRRTRGELLGKSVCETLLDASESESYALFRDAVSRRATAQIPSVRVYPGSSFSVHALPMEERLLVVLARPQPVANTSEPCAQDMVDDDQGAKRMLSALSPSAFCSLTLDRAFNSLMDVKSFTETLTRGADRDNDRSPCHLFDCPRIKTLTDSVKDAIQVLEKTKGSFKSRELGDLRNRLEAIVEEVEK
jgi:hypothetical protein